MEEWEALAGLGAIIAVCAYVVGTLGCFCWLFYQGSIDLFLPIKLLVMIGLIYWAVLSFFTLIMSKSGGIGKSIQAFSLISALSLTVYAWFFSSLFAHEEVVYFSADASAWIVLLSGAFVIIIGLVVLLIFPRAPS